MNADAESFDYIVVAGIRRLPALQSSDRPRPSPCCCWGGRNDRNIKSLISQPESRVAVLVVPTDEELMIAQHTLAFLPKGTAKSTHAARDAAAMTRD
jgi:hypothetical protein